MIGQSIILLINGFIRVLKLVNEVMDFLKQRFSSLFLFKNVPKNYHLPYFYINFDDAKFLSNNEHSCAMNLITPPI